MRRTIMDFLAFYSSLQMVQVFEANEQNIRTILASARAVSGFVKRAEGHLLFHLTMNTPEDKDKYFSNLTILEYEISELKETVTRAESKEIVARMKTLQENMVRFGDQLINAYDKKSEEKISFDLSQHKDILLEFHKHSSNLRRLGVNLTVVETDFLNKQAAIAAATKVSSFVKRAEGHLMLFLILNKQADEEKFFKRNKALLENISILEERLKTPQLIKLVKELKGLQNIFLGLGGCPRMKESAAKVLKWPIFPILLVK